MEDNVEEQREEGKRGRRRWWIPFIRKAKIGKSIETENILVVIRGCREEAGQMGV